MSSPNILGNLEHHHPWRRDTAGVSSVGSKKSALHVGPRAPGDRLNPWGLGTATAPRAPPAPPPRRSVPTNSKHKRDPAGRFPVCHRALRQRAARHAETRRPTSPQPPGTRRNVQTHHGVLPAGSNHHISLTRPLGPCLTARAVSILVHSHPWLSLSPTRNGRVTARGFYQTLIVSAFFSSGPLSFLFPPQSRTWSKRPPPSPPPPFAKTHLR